MGADAAEIAASLPPWLQTAANAALFVVTVVTGLIALRRGRAEGASESAPHGAEDLPESSLARRALAAVESLVDNARLQTEALKTISAAATGMAKTVEDDFDERRVQREVDRRLALTERARAGNG